MSAHGKRRPADIVREAVAAAEVVPLRSGETARARVPDWAKPPRPICVPLSEMLSPGRRSGDAMDDETDQALGAVFRQAYEEGLRNARHTIEVLMERYHEAIAEVEGLREQLLETSEGDLVELALRIACEVMRSEPEGLRRFSQEMARYAVESLREVDNVVLRVSPSDMAAIAEKRPELMEVVGSVKIVEDRSLHAGGVVAECELGRLDATLDGRLQVVAQRLREHRGARQAANNDDGTEAALPLGDDPSEREAG